MSQRPRSFQILVVDDEPHILQVLKLKLESAGHEVVTAENGEDALELILHCPPDLVITDLTMPLVDGLELLRAMLKIDRAAKIPCLLLTGKLAPGQQPCHPLLHNIRGVVKKPFSPRELLDTIERVLGISDSPLAQAS